MNDGGPSFASASACAITLAELSHPVGVCVQEDSEIFV